jgi:hypothetical protein
MHPPAASSSAPASVSAPCFALRGTGRAAPRTLAPAPHPPRARGRGLLFDAADLPRIRANVQRPEFASSGPT